jgi:hypothetical protein
VGTSARQAALLGAGYASTSNLVASSTSAGGLLQHSSVQASTQTPLVYDQKGRWLMGVHLQNETHLPHGREAVLGAGTVSGLLHLADAVSTGV